MGKKKEAKGENVHVVVRIRPLSDDERVAGAEEVMRIGADKTSIQVLLPDDQDYAGSTRQSIKKFALDGCLPTSTTQEQCFDQSGVKTLLDSVRKYPPLRPTQAVQYVNVDSQLALCWVVYVKQALEGFSATVFAYGQTGSGKTYTMAGGQDDWERQNVSAIDGVIPRSVRYLFDQVSARQDKVKYTVRASFLEIYNENVRDLWNPSSGCLSIREYPPGYWRGFYVEDLYIFECTNVEDMLFMLSEGMRHRAVGSHNLNKDSSRSHSMLTFYLESEEESDGEPYVKFGKISFVDLAGSERLKETQGTDATMGGAQDFQATFRSRARMKGDEMLKETGNINKSLFTLGKVISALGDASKRTEPSFVPYRDSKLTKLLMDSLGGASKALMFACCSPADSYLEETLNTLSYAARARNITNKPAVQVDPHEELVRELRAQMKELKAHNTRLQKALSRCANCPDCPASVRDIVDQALNGALDCGSDPDSPLSTPPDEVKQKKAGAGRRRGQQALKHQEEFDEEPAGGSGTGGVGRRQRRGGGRGDRHDDGFASTMEVGPSWAMADGEHDPEPEDSWDADPISRRRSTGSGGGRRVGGGRRNASERSSFEEPTPDDSEMFLRALEGPTHSSRGRSRDGGKGGSVPQRRQGTTEDPLLPDSLLDGSSDWKNELDAASKELYRELGLALYRATSQEEMSSAMKGLQQFERDHREAAIRRAEQKGGNASSEDDAFRKMAMSFYKEDSSDLRSTRKATELSRMHRRRGTPAGDAMGAAGETW